MVRFFRCHILSSSRRVCAIILAFALLLGFIFGGVCSGYADSSLSQLMHMAALAPVSIVSLLPVLLLPFLLSAIAVFLGHYWLAVSAVFTKAFLVSYLSCIILIAYPSSGPLFLILFLWSDLLTLPVLCLFCFRRICDRKVGTRIIWITGSLILGIGLLDCYIVSPFLASLLS